MHRRPEAGAVLRDAVEIDHRDLADALLEHGDARVDDLLPLLRRLVLGILAEVAKLARALNLLGEFDLQLALQCRDLVIEPLENPVFHLGFRL